MHYIHMCYMTEINAHNQNNWIIIKRLSSCQYDLNNTNVVTNYSYIRSWQFKFKILISESILCCLKIPTVTECDVASCHLITINACSWIVLHTICIFVIVKHLSGIKLDLTWLAIRNEYILFGDMRMQVGLVLHVYIYI